ncbi:uncharacterized protein [Ptychodera flava]|uniref:uncharacterized protein n=1 Tax=Ptychodera flava TaxID=63121 RepID=UPI00396A25C2
MLLETRLIVKIFVKHLFGTWAFEAVNNGTDQHLQHDFMCILKHTCHLLHLVGDLGQVCDYDQYAADNSTSSEHDGTMTSAESEDDDEEDIKVKGANANVYVDHIKVDVHESANASAQTETGKRQRRKLSADAICENIADEDFILEQLAKGTFDTAKSKALQMVETFVILREFKLYLLKVIIYFHVFEEHFEGCYALY